MEDLGKRFIAMMAIHQEKLSGSGVSIETQLDGMKQCIDNLTKTVTRLIESGSRSEKQHRALIEQKEEQRTLFLDQLAAAKQTERDKQLEI